MDAKQCKRLISETNLREAASLVPSPHTVTEVVREGTLRGCASELINHMARMAPEKYKKIKKSKEKGSLRQSMSKLKMVQFCIVIPFENKEFGVQGLEYKASRNLLCFGKLIYYKFQ